MAYASTTPMPRITTNINTEIELLFLILSISVWQTFALYLFPT
jgi:hypothetical protein